MLLRSLTWRYVQQEINMDVKAVLIKLKPNSENDVQSWKNEIERLRDQAIQSLRNENITIESWFKTEISGEKYLLAYIRANDIKKSQKIAANSTLEVDKIHQQFKRNCFEKNDNINFELLVDLSNLK